MPAKKRPKKPRVDKGVEDLDPGEQRDLAQTFAIQFLAALVTQDRVARAKRLRAGLSDYAATPQEMPSPTPGDAAIELEREILTAKRKPTSAEVEQLKQAQPAARVIRDRARVAATERRRTMARLPSDRHAETVLAIELGHVLSVDELRIDERLAEMERDADDAVERCVHSLIATIPHVYRTYRRDAEFIGAWTSLEGWVGGEERTPVLKPAQVPKLLETQSPAAKKAAKARASKLRSEIKQLRRHADGRKVRRIEQQIASKESKLREIELRGAFTHSFGSRNTVAAIAERLGLSGPRRKPRKGDPSD